jgi:glycosyltransferase involved in cell wall biosynthesis
MSVLTQTYSNLELLVADDCSTDGSVAVLSSIQDPRLKTFFFEKNRGTVYTLNFLLQQAKGDYLVTLGSDDWFYPEKLEKQLKVMEEDPSLGAVFSWAQIVDGNDAPYGEDHAFSVHMFQEKNRSQSGWLRYFFADGNHLCHSSAMVRRSVQDAIGLYRASYRQLHDFEYWLRLLCSYPIYVIPEKLVAYRRMDEVSSVSASKSNANTIRLYNEFNMAFYELFVNMDGALFGEAFADMLECKDLGKCGGLNAYDFVMDTIKKTVAACKGMTVEEIKERGNECVAI